MVKNVFAKESFNLNTGQHLTLLQNLIRQLIYIQLRQHALYCLFTPKKRKKSNYIETMTRSDTMQVGAFRNKC